jgi:hypothetical protein
MQISMLKIRQPGDTSYSYVSLMFSELVLVFPSLSFSELIYSLCPQSGFGRPKIDTLPHSPGIGLCLQILAGSAQYFKTIGSTSIYKHILN